MSENFPTIAPAARYFESLNRCIGLKMAGQHVFTAPDVYEMQDGTELFFDTDDAVRTRFFRDDPDRVMSPSEQQGCTQRLSELMDVYTNPSATMKQTGISSVYYEVAPSSACSKFIATRMQQKFRGHEFFTGFSHAIVQGDAGGGDWPVRQLEPYPAVRVEMNKV